MSSNLRPFEPSLEAVRQAAWHIKFNQCLWHDDCLEADMAARASGIGEHGFAQHSDGRDHR
jgi:hypothetical protein